MKSLISLAFVALLLASSINVWGYTPNKTKSGPDSFPNDTFTYNLPCRVVNIHQEKKGKSWLFLWLHGGVHDQKKHDIFAYNHFDCCDADDSIIAYFQRHNIKAIALLPVCYKANLTHCIAWRECFSDVKAIMDDYISKGLIDPKRIYIAGASDGGTGTWDYIESHGELFAAGMPLSCERPRKTSIPTYFFGTSDEEDCTKQVNELRSQGYTNIQYKYCPQYKHGGDAAECTDSFLKEFFSHTVRGAK